MNYDNYILNAEILANIKDGVLIACENMTILAANAAATRITGYEETEIIGLSLPTFLFKRLDQNLRTQLSLMTQTKKQDRFSINIVNKTKSGADYAATLSVTKINAPPAEYLAILSPHNTLLHPVTKLPSKEFLIEYLYRVISFVQRDSAKQLAIFFIDIDDFKLINDTFGHQVGDEVLEKVSKNIKNASRTMDFLSHVGGDEFILACIIDKKTSSRAIASISSRLLTAIKQTAVFVDKNYQINASIGASFFDATNDPNTSPLELICSADLAMIQKKIT